jgi:arylsulfatase A-like enzyme
MSRSQSESRIHRMLSRRCGFYVAAMVGLIGSGPAGDSVAFAAPPNVVFILADDLGYTDLACYGSKYYETPNIDRLAKEGVRFTDGYTCGPNCQPTRAAFMSGQYGPRTGVYTVGGVDRFDWQARPLKPVNNVQELPLSKLTWGQTLKSAGYRTAHFGKWHLGQSEKYHPLARGFDESIVSAGQHFIFSTSPKVDVPEGAYLADFLTDNAVDFIRRSQSGPFLLCLHHFGVHSPHHAKPDKIAHFEPKSGVGGHNSPVYAGMIASVDDSVGRVLATLEELKLAENTVVIFSSDNGGVGGYQREGIKKGGDITDNAPLRGGKGMLYEGGVRVPYIFRWKNTIPAGTTSGEPINSVDLYPTLLELTGAKVPADYVLDGTSYVPILKNPTQAVTGRKPLYWHFPGYLGAGEGSWRTTPAGSIRVGDWKLVEFFETGKRELYNLRDDLSETRDLADAQPAKRDELHRQLLAWRTAIHAPMPTPNNEPSETKTNTKTKKSKKKAKAAPE